MCATNDIDTDAHMDPFHSPHYKTLHACEVQAALCRAIRERGDMYSLSTHDDPNFIIAISSNKHY